MVEQIVFFFPTANSSYLVDSGQAVNTTLTCLFPDLVFRIFSIPKHLALRTLKTYSKQTNHGY